MTKQEFERKTIFVLMSTFNGEKYLNEQIESVKDQKNVETHLVIRDDGSKDNTKIIIKKWVNTYPDWITFIEGKNIGFAQSFSELLSLTITKFSNAQYFAFCDQDDVWSPEKLMIALRYLSKESKLTPVLYFSNAELVDSGLKPLSLLWRLNEVDLSKEKSLVQNFAPGCTEVFNRCAAEMYIKTPPHSVTLHDYLMFQICLFLGKVIYDEGPRIKYRQHLNNQIGKVTGLRRWVRFLCKPIIRHDISTRNALFLKVYKRFLSAQDLLLLNTFLNYKKSFFHKIALVFNRKISYSNIESNILMKIKILLGWL